MCIDVLTLITIYIHTTKIHTYVNIINSNIIGIQTQRKKKQTSIIHISSTPH
jgi:hypothetical protein